MTKLKLTRSEIFTRLDAIADSWGNPRLSDRVRADLTNTAKLEAMLKRLSKSADLNWQQAGG